MVRCLNDSYLSSWEHKDLLLLKGIGTDSTVPVKCRLMLGHQTPATRRTETVVQIVYPLLGIVVDCAPGNDANGRIPNNNKSPITH
ncbi:hypothetical protein AVEN_70028-1 [Araneus ventricosus]|uniref:Uncharacterized protein n=1 Tax=Araneus ventricosus TaxID=182803 RepID=A0A4Y2UNB8_ARAVE|nr:hypothetical protein AVEN_70028-1 [Araneus ventricosus]